MLKLMGAAAAIVLIGALLLFVRPLIENQRVNIEEMKGFKVVAFPLSVLSGGIYMEGTVRDFLMVNTNVIFPPLARYHYFVREADDDDPRVDRIRYFVCAKMTAHPLYEYWVRRDPNCNMAATIPPMVAEALQRGRELYEFETAKPLNPRGRLTIGR